MTNTHRFIYNTLTIYSMRINYLFPGIFWCLVFFLSCSVDHQAPLITFLSPESEGTHDAVHYLEIKAFVEDDIQIQSYELFIESFSGAVIYKDNVMVGNDYVDIDYTIDISKLNVAGLEISIKAWDTEGEKSENKIVINIL